MANSYPELALINTFSNLFYACPVCNIFKGEDFPTVPLEFTYDLHFFPDPSIYDYTEFFDIEPQTGRLLGKYPIANYLIEIFHLNRPHLVIQRRFYSTFSKIEETERDCRRILAILESISKTHPDTGKILDFYHKLSSFLLEMNELKSQLEKIRLYQSNEDLR